jgi:hypothetical protein
VETRRRHIRKTVSSVHFQDLTSLDTYSVLVHQGQMVDANIKGFLIEIKRSDLASDSLKKNLHLDSLIGEKVALFLPQMNLDLDGTIIRAAHVGKGSFELVVSFSPDVPEYWRECLIELLPGPGEMEDLA